MEKGKEDANLHHDRKKNVKAKKQSKKEKPAKKASKEKKPLAKAENPWDVLRFVLMTEKCVRNIELNNEISFVVRRSATKRQISDAFETVFETRVDRVRVVIDQKNRKKAYIKLAEAGQAGEIAIKLGII